MNFIHSITSRSMTIVIVTVAAIALVVGFSAGRIGGGGPETVVNEHDHAAESPGTIWTCSMHPQIRMNEPGRCPICGMDLIPVVTGDSRGSDNPRELTLSPAAEKLAEIAVAPVERRLVERTIPLVGKIALDETRIKYITAWTGGRIDRLYIDYTGMPVSEGDRIADLYSPSLYAAGEEYLQALGAAGTKSAAGIETVRRLEGLTLDASREKLRLLGMTPEQIEALAIRGKPDDHVTVFTRTSGVIMHKNVSEGAYVDTGAKLFTVADLSHIWAMLDVYESDLQWIRYGQEVTFTSEAYPGETFSGKISFIAPRIDDRTRTVQVRVNVTNSSGKLKPDMFVRADVKSKIAAGGLVVDPLLAGKYICPAHPEVVSSVPGTCDLSGRTLVKAADLGYAEPADAVASLVIPDTAPLVTGRRAVVYVKEENAPGTYSGRDIELGPKADGFYQVVSGLAEGNLVVVNGSFKIDSALQIRAKKSMMGPDGGVMLAAHAHDAGTMQGAEMAADTAKEKMPATEQGAEHADITGTAMKAGDQDSAVVRYDAPETFLKQLDGVYTAYFTLQYALSHDDAESVKKAAASLGKSLEGVDMTLLAHDAHMAWMKLLLKLNAGAAEVGGAGNIDAIRKTFSDLSGTMIRVERTFGHAGGGETYMFHCPMANNNTGADWMQNKEVLENPYFGSSMFKCGSMITSFKPVNE